MMIRVNGEYLDFNDAIEIESQIKLFEEIGSSNGDFSYSFDVAKTMNNLKILGFPYPDTIKSIYRNVRCEILDDSGFKVYPGSLQVEGTNEVIRCAFFSGNNDWFGLLSDPMNTLPLYKYDTDLTEANIQASWLKTEGLVFPIQDTGALITRSFANLKVEDFSANFYVKTLFKEIFNPLGIKLQGDLIEDVTFNQLTLAANGRSQESVEDRSIFVKKTTTQNNISSSTHITFEDSTTFPYFIGETGNFSSDTYTPDVKMRLSISFTLNVSYDALTLVLAGISVNGSAVLAYVVINSVGSGSTVFSRTQIVEVEAGDTVNVFVFSSGSGSADVTGGDLKITPVYIYRVFGSSSVPNWTKAEFVSAILGMFNALPSYNADSKTLTLDLFNKIKEKEPIDISDDVNITDIDFTEFVSNYAKNNYFKYQEGDDEDLREYNISNFISYGSGSITVANDFIENDTDVFESEFTSPITYLNGIFDMSMERFNFVELEEDEEEGITSVTDSSGAPRFNISDADDTFEVGDLVKLATINHAYNGEWVINGVTSTYITVNGLGYDSSFVGTVIGTATLLKHKFTTDDNVYLFVNVPNVNTLFFSSKSSIILEDDTTFSTTAIAYFNLLSNGRQINTKYKQSLSFGEVNNPLSYQQTLIQTYWGIFSDVLEDPVMLICEGHFDRNKFQLLKTFLRPLRLKTKETNNLYYLNRISGYQSGHEACVAELIKL